MLINRIGFEQERREKKTNFYYRTLVVWRARYQSNALANATFKVLFVIFMRLRCVSIGQSNCSARTDSLHHCRLRCICAAYLSVLRCPTWASSTLCCMRLGMSYMTLQSFCHRTLALALTHTHTRGRTAESNKFSKYFKCLYQIKLRPEPFFAFLRACRGHVCVCVWIGTLACTHTHTLGIE